MLLSVLCLTSCWSSRKAVFRAQASQRLEVRDTLREQVMVTVTDTLREVTTITVRESETGDTLRMTTVTDRTRASSRDRYHDIQEKVIVRTDTVYVEKDSVAVKEMKEIPHQAPQPPLTRNLKWLFFILLAIITLIIIIRWKIFKYCLL